MAKKIAKIEVTKSGSNPDVDSDFHTEHREKAIEHVQEIYGKDNVANIVTFGTLAGKAAFKQMSTIYEANFAQANKITSLYPPMIEGVTATLDDIYNPDSDRYAEGADFREAVSGENWQKIIEGARNIEGRNKSTGVHACFVAGTLIKTLDGYKEIENIELGDYVLTHTNTYKEVVDTMTTEDGEIFYLQAANSIPSKVTGNHPFYTRSIIRNPNKPRELSEPVWKTVDELSVNDDLIGIPVNQDSKIPDSDLNLPFEDPSFWWVAGRFLGDGWCEEFDSIRNRKRKDGTPYEYKRKEKNLVISVGYNDPTHDYLIEAIEKNFKYRISPNRTTNKIYVHGDDVFEYFKKFGKYAVNKEVPGEVLSLPIELLKSFVEGYLSADGHYEVSNGYQSFSTVSKKLTLSMIAAINKVYKTHCSVAVSKRDQMVIEGRIVNCHDKYTVSFKEGRTSKLRSFYEDGYIWAGLAKVEKTDDKELTYNFSVLDDNSYVANGLIVHNCGIVMSSVPLSDAIPLHVRQSDQRTITQWTYPECESLGLIKMDFLGLDTVDLIQNTVSNIIKNGKTPPNMIDIIHGEMDDPAVYKLFQEGHTTGIFQFGSEMVRNLLLLTKPTEFADLPAITSVARPGPMRMQSHTKYADRKNGREEIDYIHPEFKGTVMEEILGKTRGLVIYQEQVQQISNRVAGMTLQEGDDLRRAMGKKKKKVMDAMRPKFFEGAMANGFSEEAVTTLWNTLEPFAKYGFNKSHAVAYAMNSYQSAYLKTHYPVEFMAALIAQHVDDKDKTLDHLREASRMGLKVSTVDINLSDVKVSPNYSKKDNHTTDIFYGLAGVKAVSSTMAEIIIKERENNGQYSSVKDVIDRCYPLGVRNKKIYENLALVGAFDNFGVSRKKVFESLPQLLDSAKTDENKGDSLFDMFEVSDDSLEIDLTGDDYSFLDRLKKEADTIGLYLSAHPTDKVGQLTNSEQYMKLNKLMNSSRTTTTTVIGSLLDIQVKRSRSGAKSMILNIDDGTGFLTANVAKPIVQGVDKTAAQEKIRKAYEEGKGEIKTEVLTAATNIDVQNVPELEKYGLYVMNITFRPGRDDSPYGARINWIRPLQLTDDGSLPIRIRFKKTSTNGEKMEKLNKILAPNLGKKIPGESSIYTVMYSEEDLMKNDEALYMVAFDIIQKNSSTPHEWPPKLPSSAKNNERILSNEEKILAIENLPYQNSGYKTEKSQKVEQAIEKFVGYGAYDFGVFNPNSLDND